MSRTYLTAPWKFAASVCIATLAILASCKPTDAPATAGPSEEAVGHNILGTALLGQQKWADAESAFRASIAAGATEPIPYNNIAVALVQQGKIDEAEAVLDQALAIDPDYLYARYNMGLIEKNRGDAAAAVVQFEAVAAQAPEDLLTQYNLGSVYAQLDRGAESRAAYEAALAQNPTHVSTLYGLGRFLLQNGEQEEGARLIRLSQEIRMRSGLDEAVGTQYGEQGPFAMGVDYRGDALPAPAPIAVTFAAEATLDAPGPGTAFIRDAAGATRLLVTSGSSILLVASDGTTEEVVAARGTVLALASGDVDNDATIDLVIVTAAGDGLTVEIHRGTDSGFAPLDASDPVAATLPDGAAPVALTLVDREHDGDLDLFLCAADSDCLLVTNDGTGSFEALPTSEHGFSLEIDSGPESGPVQVGFSDIDNDQDIDLLALNGDGMHVYSNMRDGTFKDVTSALGLDTTAGAVAFAIADIDKNSSMDLVLAGPSGPQLLENDGTRFTAATLGAQAAGVTGILAMDFDNDGFLDIVASQADAAPLVLRNGGQGHFEFATPFPAIPDGARVVATYDANADGGLDVLLRGVDGRLMLMTNDGGSVHRWASIESTGVGDNRFGIGSKVEVLAGALRQKFEVVDTRPVHVGLGTRATIESVRHHWPSGVLQDEVEQPAGDAVRITQLDRKGTSCPLLYAWDGARWRFVTDFLGGAAIGYQKARGVYGTPDTDEIVKIEGGLAVGDDGTVRVRLNNQLEEVLWFDRVELIAVDHPANTEVFPNERLMPGPPWPEYRLFASDRIHPVRGARGVESGRDFAAILETRDRRYVDDFAQLPFKGYAEPHTLELELGDFPRGTRVVLLLDGWIDYADSSANIGAEQAALILSPPLLTVADGRGGWQTTGHRMGFPAGLPKTMAVELTDLFATQDHRVRIATNMRIYWDRARVMIGGADTALTETRIEPTMAELRFGGFPDPVNHKPPTYDAAHVTRDGGWKSHAGAYTAFGDVRDLLGAVDDRFVTTRNGDEIELRFPAPPPPRRGLTRTWLLFTDGFGKDMDPNSAANAAVGPMPFHGMPAYPYADDLVPPVAASQATRVVLHGDDGQTGALPQVLAGRREQD